MGHLRSLELDRFTSPPPRRAPEARQSPGAFQGASPWLLRPGDCSEPDRVQCLVTPSVGPASPYGWKGEIALPKGEAKSGAKFWTSEATIYMVEAIAIGLEAIAIRLEAIATSDNKQVWRPFRCFFFLTLPGMEWPLHANWTRKTLQQRGVAKREETSKDHKYR